MIWLASFPRSGNTFFRNVLYEVYGIESSTYHQEPNRPLDQNFADFQFVKTHLLPHKLPKQLRDFPSVYLVRDGRDSLVSIAHHRKDIVKPGTDFYNNLLEAILAQAGSFFGGWSRNVQDWTAKADIVIRFEDLIVDPIGQVERLRAIVDLPEPDLTKLPSFKDLKFGNPKYGARKGARIDSKLRINNFRRGKAGGWKDELPEDLEKLLWKIHGAALLEWGYAASEPAEPTLPKRVMIEASKLYSHDNDGVKRYLAELVNGFSILLPHLPEWEVFLYDHKSIQPLPQRAKAESSLPNSEFNSESELVRIKQDRHTMGYEKRLLLLKLTARKIIPAFMYRRLSAYYRTGPFRSWLQAIKLKVRRRKFNKSGAEIFAGLKEADLIHLPLPQHYTELGNTERPLLVTVHDLTHQIFPAFHTAANVELAEKGMQELLDKKAHWLAVSQATAEDVQRIYKLAADRIYPVAEAANTELFHPHNRQEDIGWLRTKYKIPAGPYLLCLSTIEPRKNLRNTLLAFTQLKAEYPDLQASLVVCGKSGWKTEEIFAGIDLERADIVFTGFVNDAHLPPLYAHARALCYASFYEGFGLPILEALACKTPVIYGNNSSMPEVAGDGGVGLDPHDVSAIQEAMYLLLTDDDLWQQKTEAGWRHANKFSWLKTALETLAVYERVIEAEA